MRPADIMQKLECLEKDLRELRLAIGQTMMPEVDNSDKQYNDNLQYTLEDLYDAFGRKKHYAIRLKNALDSRGILTMKEFLTLSPGELLSLDGIGPGTLERIKKALDRLGVQW